MRALDAVVFFVAGVGVGLLLASMLDRVERRVAAEAVESWPSP